VKRLHAFAYFEASTVGEAAAALAAANGTARPLAGGTDLVVDMKSGRARPEAVVNLKRIPGLSGITRGNGGLTIGGLCRIRDLELSPDLARTHRALSMAAAVLGPPGVRALATIGGNIGRASPASDMAPPLIVHRAVVGIEGISGRRQAAMEDLWTGPGLSGLAPDEIVTSVFLPDPRPRSGTAHLKAGRRGGGTDLAIVGVSAGLVLEGDGTIAEARIVLASVGPTPVRAREAEQILRGARLTEARLGDAAAAAAHGITPIDDVRGTARYRRMVAGVLVARALRDALGAAEASPS
jgi:carbon-monoxide dehydrogenase medium subunit